VRDHDGDEQEFQCAPGRLSHGCLPKPPALAALTGGCCCGEYGPREARPLTAVERDAVALGAGDDEAEAREFGLLRRSMFDHVATMEARGAARQGEIAK
jgi:hypothetical protein